MRTVRLLSVFSVAALLCLGLASGQDDVIKAIDAKQYYPANHGLTDLSCTIKMPQLEMVAPGIKFRLYWKAPGKSVVHIEGLTDEQVKKNPMLGMMRQQLDAASKEFGRLIIPEPLTALAKSGDVKRGSDGDLTTVTIKEEAGSRTFWFTSDYKPVRVKQSANVMGQSQETTAEVEVTDEGGEYLRKTFTGKMKLMGQDVESITTWKYESFEGVLLPVSIDTITKMQGMEIPQVYSVTDHQVNKGIDPAIFGEEANGGDAAPPADPTGTKPRDDF